MVLSDKFFLLLLFLQMISKSFWLFLFPNNNEDWETHLDYIILRDECFFLFLLEIIWGQEKGNHLVYSKMKFYMYLKKNSFHQPTIINPHRYENGSKKSRIQCAQQKLKILFLRCLAFSVLLCPLQDVECSEGPDLDMVSFTLQLKVTRMVSMFSSVRLNFRKVSYWLQAPDFAS